MKRLFPIFIIAVLLSIPASAEEWYRSYMKGVEAVEKNNCDDAARLLTQALSKNPTEDLHSKPYGTFILEYIPNYYLARCAFQKEDYEGAKKLIDLANASGAGHSSKSGEFIVLRNRILAKLKETQPAQ